MLYWIGYLSILCLDGGGLIGLLIYLHRKKRPYSALSNLVVVGLALFLSVMVLEFYLKLFFAQTDSVPTLANDNWLTWYHPEESFNALGYRDVEWTDELVINRTKVMVVGDSFVAGLSLKNPEDRFSNRVGPMLGDNFVVFNLGKNGANRLQSILQPPDIKADPKWRWFLSLYDEPEVWWLHQQELLSVYEGAQAEQIPLVMVIFPSMTYVEESRLVTDRVVDLFEERGVPTINVADLIATTPPGELVASPVDSHPSALVHGLVAEALYEEFRGLSLIE